VWVAGHWERPPHPHAVWVEPRWEHRGHGYVFVEGYWH
jgi:alpha-mannosidase